MWFRRLFSDVGIWGGAGEAEEMRRVTRVLSSGLASVLSHLLAAFIYYWVVELEALDSLLFVREVVPTNHEERLIVVAVVGKTVMALVAAALTRMALVGARVARAARGVHLGICYFTFFFLMVDLYLYQRVGRHVLELAAFAALPEWNVAAGSKTVWVVRLATLALYALPFALVAEGVTSLAERRLARVGPSILAVLLVPLLLIFSSAATLSSSRGAEWRTLGLQARLQGALPFPLAETQKMVPRHVGDPIILRLEDAFRHRYVETFTHIFRKRRAPDYDKTIPAARGNVFVVMIESLRADALTAELMPRVTAWSGQALRRTNHYAGTNLSESGAFAIMFGQNPLIYGAVLDSDVAPPLCEGLRAVNYKCAYYTGHPTVWWGREKFLSSRSMDDFERISGATWAEWDRKALGRLGELTRKKGGDPWLGITFLISTHYEYRYPPEFERYLPAEEPGVGFMAHPDLAVPEGIGNRYKNALGFVDDAVSKFLAEVDLERDYVIVTGDHGEALGERGRFGHGFDFAENVTHVPFLLAGPGIKPGVLDGVSLHADIWLTVESLIHGRAPRGADLRANRSRASRFLTHQRYGGTRADALLVVGDLRISLALDLKEADLHIEGFENEVGAAVPVPKITGEQEMQLVDAFERELRECAAELYPGEGF